MQELRYQSAFDPPKHVSDFLHNGRIISADESPAQMVDRVVDAISTVEASFTQSPEAVEPFSNALGSAMDAGEIVMSTPILTNAGRYHEKPLTACTVPTIPISGDKAALKAEIITLHEQGMGTGFNLNDADDPVEMLRFLNQIAIESASSGHEDRPVGNMGVLSVYHPNIREFIASKVSAHSNGEDWKFNISIDVDDLFMQSVEADGHIELWDGQKVRASQIFADICSAAADCADPGLVFLDRMNFRNPTPDLGQYTTTAPCGEVGLLPGETCQFGYLNLGKFVRKEGSVWVVDYERMRRTAQLLTRSLDDALEISKENFPSATSARVLSYKRKIGVGVCGVADALTMLGLPYDSDRARQVVADMLSWINMATKNESETLARERGSFEGMINLFANRHLQRPSLIEQLYGDLDTETTLGSDWRTLAERVRQTRLLRNATTTALPPTGRSALVVSASTGIEPHFTIGGMNDSVLAAADDHLMSRDLRLEDFVPPIECSIPGPNNRWGHELLQCAKDIHPLGHIAMAATAQRFTDEAVSKTINLEASSTASEVETIYFEAYKVGMSGVTVYIDGTHDGQPRRL